VTTNEVCDKLDGSCICQDGLHGEQCQFGESSNKLRRITKHILNILTNTKYLQNVSVKTAYKEMFVMCQLVNVVYVILDSLEISAKVKIKIEKK
jgi:hypothetical protein